jgi:hypothetical protein
MPSGIGRFVRILDRLWSSCDVRHIVFWKFGEEQASVLGTGIQAHQEDPARARYHLRRNRANTSASWRSARCRVRDGGMPERQRYSMASGGGRRRKIADSRAARVVATATARNGRRACGLRKNRHGTLRLEANDQAIAFEKEKKSSETLIRTIATTVI